MSPSVIDFELWTRPSKLDADADCTLKAFMEKDIPDSPPGGAAERGSTIHAIGEHLNRQAHEETSKMSANINHADRRFPSSITELPYFDDEAVELAEEMVALTDPIVLETKKAEGKVYFEKKLTIPKEYSPNFKGSSDVLCVSNSDLTICDYKTGFQKVNAKDSLQLLSYAGMAHTLYDLLFDYQKIRMIIVQPTLDHFDEWVVTRAFLEDWLENFLKPKLKEIESGTGKFKVGKGCTYCKAAPVCPARREHHTRITRLDFMEPKKVPDELIVEFVMQLPDLLRYGEQCNDYLTSQSLKGKKFPGVKLVQANTRRKYSDESAVAETLVAAGIDSEKIHEKKLKNMTSLKKLLGQKKFGELVEPMLVKPTGAPTLVREDDPREEYVRPSTKEDFIDV